MVQQKKYSLDFTEDELIDRARDLETDENVTLFLKSLDGQRKFEELQKIRQVLEKK